MSANKKPLLPPEVTIFLKQFSIKFIGIIVLIISISAIISLFSFRATDPSFNTASSSIALNIMGLYGSYISDLLFQIFGIAAFLPCLFLIETSLFLIKNSKVNHFFIKTFAMVLTTVLASSFFAGFNQGNAWPVMSGLGGAIGYLIHIRSLKIIPFLNLPQYLTWLTTLFFGFTAILFFSISFAINLRIFNRFIIKIINLKNNIKGIFYPNHSSELEAYDIDETISENEDYQNDTKIIKTKPKKEKKEPNFDASENNDQYLVERSSKETTNNATRSKSDLVKSDSYILPNLNLLSSNDSNKNICDLSDDELNAIARQLEKILNEFGIKGEIVKIRPGPVVTLYELDPAPGTKTSRVVGLADDIARSMSAISVRIAVVVGSNTIGIELPNEKRKTVFLKDLLSSKEALTSKNPLNLVLGKDIGGKNIFADLAKMPHLLIAGTTGSGKSVAVNSMILSLLFRLSPEECRLIMIDPKMLEFTPYNGIPHLLTPVVTDPSKAVVALKWAVREMEDRYKAMSILSVRNIETYNAKLKDTLKNNEKILRTVQTGFDAETGKPVYEEQELDLSFFPYIVVIVDEMADLMMVAGKDVEATIQRLAQMARAAGIHIIMATQRPSVDVITGTIKANFPTRISFNVTSRIDSRTILGEQGAEQLLGRGDMLYMPSGMRPIRIHGPFVDDKERDAVINYLKEQAQPEYISAVVEDNQQPSDYEKAMNLASDNGGNGNDLYDQAVAIVLNDRKVSTSYIQRRLRIGYNRAAELVERMESEGLISPANHVGKREILVPEQDNY
ncbi:MAG: DNA translocase FtsK [Alphaproteobacteria bacterium]